LTWLALACALSAAAAAEEPTHWLLRMNQALTSSNYDGTFAHWQGGPVEMLRIIHRVQDGAVAERLVSLDTSRREFIRSGTTLTCYLPDQHTVLVEHRSPQESLFGFPKFNEQTAKFYDIQELARTRFNRHDTHLITVSSKDEFRYGYRLWIDDATALPLKTQLCDSHGRTIEQIEFASFTPMAHIPDAAFKPDVSTEGFQWLRSDAPPKEPQLSSSLVWSPVKLPPGFRMMARSAQILPGLPNPVDQMVFTDGLASVSVFVEVYQNHTSAGDVTMTESARVGSSSAFSTVIDGHRITAVGEVPPVTVRFIASSLRAQGAADGSSSHAVSQLGAQH